MSFVIAIDGPAASGKSSVAKLIAERLGFSYLDTGAMYRAHTLYLLENNIDVYDENSVVESLKNIDIKFDKTDIYLNNVNVSKEIRNNDVTRNVSIECAYEKVRIFMVDLQRKIAKENSTGVVLDGRDIGTVVFPNAEVKIYLTADYDTRAKRRYLDNKARGIELEDIEKIKQDLIRRDTIDSTREFSPLKQASDAILLDNSHINKEETLNEIIKIVEEKKNAKK